MQNTENHTDKKKVAFYTLGCKLNYSETSTISRMFESKGYEKVEFNQKPDIFIINTCSVTENADKKCKKIVKEANKINPDGYVTIIGCYAQLKPQEIADIEGVDAVLGAAEKFQLIDLLDGFVKEPSGQKAKVYNQNIEEAIDYHTSYSLNDRTRTFLKVQDGCDYPCAYCTIPLARGASRSDSIANVVKAAQEIAASGVKEIVLTGVNIGDFGLRNGTREETFFDLVKALDEVEGINRFRISSIEPNLLTDEIIAFVAQSKRFVPHFHIPLQSGSNKVLGLMRRRYKRELYVDRVQKIKELMPDCCIGVDVIVGHPGETEEEFLETYNFLNELPISYLHVFTYSERENTTALTIKPVVPQSKRAERSKMLHILSDKKRRYFYEQQLGKSFEVLFEEDVEDGQMQGFTENYVRVTAKYDPLLINETKQVALVSINEKMLVEVQEAEVLFESH
ncbi:MULTISPECIES: tRNA (N(6)-L-threonylcarbamoyladenosine(37)-C(2))-methylthiotransferase MtaB [Flectobacillus]|jgi:threonylcarbamoyladenosine tRNA methylthiotransferase MtaB|uniref:tRNA (N(6)-L-threonylcarbamoyladenosine(37)-C(2))- methylthiotransferase MtaB n=1 Tax=Flectobacillus TaxID=101 RepID=UPI000BA4C4E4|nr:MULTISPECIES: tRNA (N(6)-L-threonylcarbamoyladenosine(37)-C(2))-methylthiotransferase MtaB [Flectobacillus]MDI9867701.1 tRNA (N(6)-L-threonylcarbamoyladenosine(37)-C(2))-methylthiotransferase MtaB [Flectobacillus roseus]NBA75471.1 tRNA (N(6)-L-threonylcarbamoyladenosine(37)-C(2))-methylthiotransferase MtaB [Emticicia sp. ODNR4P]PAC28326.1 tRNA (N(6)-L-threonylcarbamoyladenosine(37)-C(2))-methylthiotransferase MtaB [Flectobacillus sp. BAB-3569]